MVPYRGQERAPRDGDKVQLTVDLHLQNIVEDEIDAAMREYRPQKATIILMRPETGEILAMANRPNFDLNERATAKPEEMKNRAIIDMMEPGSTFKIVTAAAALNERKVRPDSIIFCENGAWSYGGKVLHDHGHGYGELSVQDILVHSSNIGAAKLALSLGEQKFFEYIRRFGFGEQTGIELPGEIRGLVRSPRSWTKISITRIPMGHEVGVTPLQMTLAMAAIANGGKLVTPRIVKSITSADGKTSTFSPIVLRQVISPEAAAQVGNALRGVVSDRGTAAGAAVPGFTIAGKTGTAQKLEKGVYDAKKTVVSFSGYLPAEHPEFVGLVVLDDPQTATREENYGGKIAGPIFAREDPGLLRDVDPRGRVERVGVGRRDVPEGGTRKRAQAGQLTHGRTGSLRGRDVRHHPARHLHRDERIAEDIGVYGVLPRFELPEVAHDALELAPPRRRTEQQSCDHRRRHPPHNRTHDQTLLTARTATRADTPA